MKLIKAIVKPGRLQDVKNALAAAGVEGLTITEVRGYGRQKGKKEVYRGTAFEPDLLQKVSVELAVEAKDVDKIIDVIRQTANTNTIGDGKIFVTPLEEVVRIRTGERGTDAL